MNNKKRSYTIYGKTCDCYFYNNGYDEGVSVFNDKGDLLFKFDEKINASQIVFLQKGYSKGSRGITKV